MENFRHTSIKGRKKNQKSFIDGDLVDSGALIFTKTCLDFSTIKKGDGFWRILIRIVQWFRWFRLNGDPSTITHVVGWDGSLAFGSDLCDPEGGGLNRHALPIVPHCFRNMFSEDRDLHEDGIEVTGKKNASEVIKPEDLAVGDYEIIQLPAKFRDDYLTYQERFRNDDIKYSLKKAAKTIFLKSEFRYDTKVKGIAYGIFAYLRQPFRERSGGDIDYTK